MIKDSTRTIRSATKKNILPKVSQKYRQIVIKTVETNIVISVLARNAVLFMTRFSARYLSKLGRVWTSNNNSLVWLSTWSTPLRMIFSIKILTHVAHKVKGCKFPPSRVLRLLLYEIIIRLSIALCDFLRKATDISSDNANTSRFVPVFRKRLHAQPFLMRWQKTAKAILL